MMLGFLKRTFGGAAASAGSALLPTETTTGFCHLCGFHSVFSSYEPVDTACKRNTFHCRECGSSARQRHVAKTILEKLSPDCRSLRDFSAKKDFAIWLSEATGAMSDQFGPMQGLVRSEYFDNGVSGMTYDGILCQDILATSFAANSFDLVITQDLLEHVPAAEKAWLEIRRILKPGGYHIGTIPINWTRGYSAVRASIEDERIVHHLEPEYHSDPIRKEGILTFTDYGTDFKKYCEIAGPTELFAANDDKTLEREYGIFNNWTFCSRKES